MRKFKIDDRVRYAFDTAIIGTIVGYTTLSEVVEGDCEDEAADEPWYVIKWDSEFNDPCPNSESEVGDSIGAEAEDSLILALQVV